jgi:hypothetical protein
MSNTKMQAAAEIILQGALETLAKVHGCTVEQVCEGLKAQHAKLTGQFAELIALGSQQAVALHAENKISLI